ncbi:MAG: CDP-diacylglycerol--glycerol-3-phosphate 3-phosphatidyltransferase [Cryobacterium sp.]
MATPLVPATAPSNWNLPNLITVVRILLAPLFMWLLLADDGADGGLRWAAAALFIVAIATDGIDGAIARKYNLVTDLGKLLDPIADKILTGGALICLSILGELPWWVTAVILLREIGITVFRFVMLRDRVIPASRGGKLKTILQSVAISLALLPLWLFLGDWVNGVNTAAMTVAVILTVATGIDYLAAAARDARQKRRSA